MSNLHLFDAYLLLGIVCVVAIVLALGVGLLLAWHLLWTLHWALRDRRRRLAARRRDDADDGLTAILDIVRDADQPTQEIRQVDPPTQQLRYIIPPPWANRDDSYVTWEDFR